MSKPSAAAMTLGDMHRALQDIDGRFAELVASHHERGELQERDTLVAARLGMLGGLETEERATLLHDVALEYTPALLPVDTEDARRLLDMVASNASPRELTLALNERLEELEIDAKGVLVSDDDGDEEAGDESGKSDDDRHRADQLSGDEFCRRLSVVVGLYTMVFPRLANAKSTPTLLSLAEALGVLDVDMAVLAPGATAVRAALISLCGLLDAAWSWAQTTQDAGGEQRSILSNILFAGVASLGPRVDAGLAVRAFLDAYPKYAGMYSAKSDGLPALLRAIDTAANLGVDLDHPAWGDLLPQATYAHLIMLAARGAVPDEAIMCRLSAALSHTSHDAGMALAYRIKAVDVDEASVLLELLAPHAVSQPDPLLRLATAKLMARLVALVPPAGQVALLAQLLQPTNPFEQIRVLALGTLREQLPVVRSETVAWDTLGPLLVAIPADAQAISATDFVESPFPAWLAECANTLRVWLSTDGTNGSGIRSASALDMIQEQFLLPIDKVSANLRTTELDHGAVFALDRLEDAYLQLRKEIDAIAVPLHNERDL